MDVTPTILALLGYGIDEAGFEGKNALGPLDPNRRHYFSCWGRGPRGYVEGTTKFVVNPRSGTVVRYDLAADPLEASPVSVDEAEAERVIKAVERWQEEMMLSFPAKRFTKRLLFDHWVSWSSARNCWSYYRP
jgi:hypothetical protein